MALTYNFKKAAEELRLRPKAVMDALRLSYSKGDQTVYVAPGPKSPASGNSSFVVFIQDGSFKDFSGGAQGDMLELVALVNGWQNQKLEAVKWAYSFMGWSVDAMPQANPAEIARYEAEAKRKREAQAAQTRNKSKSLVGYWARLPSAQGTIVETYLRRARGIPLEKLGKWPDAIRFEPVAEHVDDDGVVTEWPAMVAAIYDGSTPLGIHRTYLRLDGSAKAPVRPSKKMFGSMRGGAIRLTRGAGQLRPVDAIKRGAKTPLLLGEGIETVLSAACAVPEYRAWAAGSLGNMDIGWPEYVSDVILLQDNDWKAPAQKRFEAVIAHWRKLAAQNGGQVKVVKAESGSDFNDWLNA